MKSLTRFCLLNALIFATIRTVHSGYVRIPGKVDNKIYYLFDNQQNWLQALSTCYQVQVSAEHGPLELSLATIDSAEEQTFVQNYFKEMFPSGAHHFWLAGTTLGSWDHWNPEQLRWATDGRLITYRAAFQGGQWAEPDRPLSSRETFTKCVAAGYSQAAGGQPSLTLNWNIRDCTVPHGFMCQIIE